MELIQTVVQLTSINKEQAIKALNHMIEEISRVEYDGVIFKTLVVTDNEETGEESESDYSCPYKPISEEES